jgi:glycosyltransferase involved in cell wall biosynthesis
MRAEFPPSARSRAAMSSLRLAVDAAVVAEDTRGIGRYARAILRRLIARDDVEITLLVHGPFAFRHRQALASALGSSRFFLRSSPAGSLDLDVIWHPANGTFFHSRLPSVATIHDAVPFRYPDEDVKRRVHAQKPFLDSANAARRIVAVSEFGREEIREVFAVPGERIEVIYHGVEPSFAPGPAAPLPNGLFEQRYVLFVGDPIAEPRKNFAMLYDAYRRAWPRRRGIAAASMPALVVAGAQAPAWEGVVHAGNLGDDLAARNADEGLRALYRGAAVVALASYHETFGMPMIEAMACGTPVIASDSSSLPEIGGDAALYAPPDDADAWAAALRRVTDDPALRDRLRVAGLDRATHFNWDESAAQHLALFRTVASGR